MPLEPIRSLHMKKLPLSDGLLSLRNHNQQPEISLRSKIQQAKAYGFQGNDQSINNNNQRTFSFVLNGSTVKFDNQVRTPRSVRLSTFVSNSKEKSGKPPLTLNEIYASPVTSYRESTASHRVIKSQTQVPRLNLEPKSCSPLARVREGGTPTSFSQKPIKISELAGVLQAKNEEIKNLRTNIQDLQGKVGALAATRRDYVQEIQDIEEIQKSLGQKNQIIEVYEKLITMCRGDKATPFSLKLLTTESNQIGDEELQRSSPKSARAGTILKVVSIGDVRSDNYSISSLPKSMPYTSSPSPIERAYSPEGSKGGESTGYSSHRVLTKRSSTMVQKNEDSFKIKVINTKNRSGANSYRDKKDLVLKAEFSKSVSPSIDLEGNNNYSNLLKFEGGHSPKSSISKAIQRRDSGTLIGEDLSGLVKRFSVVFKSMEENRRLIKEQNEYLRKKLDEFERDKLIPGKVGKA